MNRLSLAPLTINEAGPLDLIAAAMVGGFDAIDLRVIGPPGGAPVAPVAGNPALVKEIRRHLADTGISVFSATGIFITPDFTVTEIEPALAVVATLGGRWCLAAGWDTDRARLAGNLALACEAAARVSLATAVD
ncbi:MAG: hypothetical protein ACREFD_03890 [Stellaceae bacterium]